MRFAAALVVLLVGAASAEARVVTEQDARGGIRAELTYDRSGDEFNRAYRDFAVRIYEDDALVVRARARELLPRLRAGRLRAQALDRGARPGRRRARGRRRLLHGRCLLLLAHVCVPGTGRHVRALIEELGAQAPAPREPGRWAAARVPRTRRQLPAPVRMQLLLALPAARLALRRRQVPRGDDAVLRRGPAEVEEAAAKVLPRERARGRRQAARGRLRRNPVSAGPSAQRMAAGSPGAPARRARQPPRPLRLLPVRHGATRMRSAATCGGTATSRSAAPRRSRPSARGRRGGGR